MTQKVNINIVLLGGLKFPFNLNRFKNWQSKIFEIVSCSVVRQMPDSSSQDDWEYKDKYLERIIYRNQNADINFAIINAELEDNYYGRRLSQNTYVLSLYETGDIVMENNFDIETFVIQNIYYISTLYRRENNRLPLSTDGEATHQDIRSCLFDLNASKEDLIYSLGTVGICDHCKAKLNNQSLPSDFIKNVIRELSKIKKPMYYRILDFIKAHPIISILITAIFGIILNLIAAYIFEYLNSN